MEREIMSIMEMYKNINTSVRMDGESSDKFVVKVGVHHGSVLSPILFAVVIDELTRDVKDDVKEILHADDLAIKEKVMKVNVCKTKAFCTDAREVQYILTLLNFRALYVEKGWKELHEVHQMRKMGAYEMFWSARQR